MKKIIALLIVLCMALTGLVACGEPTPPTPTEPPITVYVSADGDDSTATGINSDPFGSLQAAVDYAAENDDKFLGITIIVKSGTYTLTSPITIANVGSENCLITIIGELDEDGAKFTCEPSAESFIILDGAKHLTIENLTFESSTGSGIVGTADYFTLKNCEISKTQGDYAVDVQGSNVLISGNYLHELNKSGISLLSGDLPNLVYSGTKITGNYIHDWSIDTASMSNAISASGVGIEVSHNTCHTSSSSAIDVFGAYNTVEYNHVYDVLTSPATLETGAVNNYGYGGSVIRYNYIHHVGIPTETVEAADPHSIAPSAIRWNGDLGYAEAYGNVIETVIGHGITMHGRSLKVKNNLIIDCSNWYVYCIATSYAQALEEGYKGVSDDYPDWVYSPVWRETNPELSKIVTDLSQTTSRDPWGWATTHGNELHSNWIHFNKYGRAFSNWGTRPYYVEDHVYTFCTDNIPIGLDGTDTENTSSYNSRRGSPDIEELLTETAAGIVDLTWEQFQLIGVQSSDWTHAVEIPALVTVETEE